jgi:hypothetical protein
MHETLTNYSVGIPIRREPDGVWIYASDLLDDYMKSTNAVVRLHFREFLLSEFGGIEPEMLSVPATTRWCPESFFKKMSKVVDRLKGEVAEGRTVIALSALTKGFLRTHLTHPDGCKSGVNPMRGASSWLASLLQTLRRPFQ